MSGITARTAYAVRVRDPLRLLGYPDRRRSALAVISRGIAGLTELSFELEPGQRGQGGGTALVRDALSAIPASELVLAAVAPGNAASVRALPSAGFIPLGSLQLFGRDGHHPGTAARRGDTHSTWGQLRFEAASGQATMVAYFKPRNPWSPS